MEGFEFVNDLGERPLGLANLTSDRSALAVGYVLGGLILGSMTGGVLPVCVISLGFLMNDMKYLSGGPAKAKLSPTKPASKTDSLPRAANTRAGRAQVMDALESLGDWGFGGETIDTSPLGATIDVDVFESLEELVEWGLRDESPSAAKASAPTPDPKPSPSSTQNPPSQEKPAAPPPQGKGNPAPKVVDWPKVTDNGLKLFDWNRLKDMDKFPHIAIYGASGDGKSYTTNLLLRFLGQKALVINPHARRSDFKGFTTVGAGSNFPACIKAIESFYDLMRERIAQLAEMDGEPQEGDFEPVNVVIDEFKAIMANVPEASRFEFGKKFAAILTEARKVRIRVIALAHSDRVKSWCLEGHGDVLDNCRWLYLASYTDFAKPSEAQNYWLGSGDYRALMSVPGGPQCADITQLSEFRDAAALPYKLEQVAPNQTKQATSQPQNDDPYPALNGYPVHQTILSYLGSNGPKTSEAVRIRLHNDRGEAKADSMTANNAIAWLLKEGYLIKDGDNLVLNR